MIQNEAEYQGAQREWQYLKEFLTRVERDPDDPNKAYSIIGIYKKMYHLWEELEEYYRARLQEHESRGSQDELADKTSVLSPT
jgi:hypothetical protein